MSKIFELNCKAQNYDWGKLGSSSKVAQLISGNNKVDEGKPYAELWMGTHPNAPSLIPSLSDKKLYDLVQEDPAKYLGSDVHTKFGTDLPFLFKVLSVGKALSIQAHPDKQLGHKLHSERPNVYKDPNHKPEMTIALTEFEALCGFRPVEQIIEFLNNVPEFGELVGDEVKDYFVSNATKDSKSSLKKLFERVMTSEEAFVQGLLNKLIKRLQSESLKDNQLNELVKRVHDQYPGDVGVWCVFLLNYVILTPGDALFLCANEPHAYLSGDCVECMATSDNVVRAGLTPKFKDVEVLVSMLTYRCLDAPEQIMKGAPFQSTKNSTLYDPPIEEFSVVRTYLKQAGDQETIEKLNGPSVLLSTQGKGKILVEGEELNVDEGKVYFIPPNTSFKLESNSNDGLITFLAYCQV